jgi:alpha-glucosidase (family GH31 glycosyl hydrolase)
MYGDTYLVAPILEAGQVRKQIYLPQGSNWKNTTTQITYNGGAYVDIDIKLEDIPVFQRCK